MTLIKPNKDITKAPLSPIEHEWRLDTCGRCNGLGIVRITSNYFYDLDRVCPTCEGYGIIDVELDERQRRIK